MYQVNGWATMHRRHVYRRDEPQLESRAMTRRRFLGVAASLAGAPWMRPAGASERSSRLPMPPGVPRALVVVVRSPKVVDDAVVHQVLLKEMFENALTTLANAGTAAEAWHSLLKPEDVIGVKFNQSGRTVIGTTDAVAETLIRSLIDAGWSPDQIVCLEAPEGTERRFGTIRLVHGYDPEPTGFGSGSDQLALALKRVTALIDVPFLKTHNIAGITCALKNLSHGLIKHPARYHGNGCSPYIGDIVALPQIRSKLRLCLVDALRVVYEGGPAPTHGTLSNEGVILAAVDPVAVDSVGLTLLNDIRKRRELPRIADSAEKVGYLATAQERGVGIAIPHGIDVVHVHP